MMITMTTKYSLHCNKNDDNNDYKVLASLQPK